MKNLLLPKIFGLIFIFLTLSFSSVGQVYKLKSTGLSSKYKIDEYSWSDWSQFEECSVLITIDMNKERITIFSKVTQVYDIAEYEGQSTDGDGDDFTSFFCVNDEGLTCRVRLAKLNSQDGLLQIYVDFSDLKWVYNVYSLD